MVFNVTREHVQQAITVARVTSSSRHLDSRGIWMHASNDGLVQVSAGNGDVNVRVDVPADVKSEGGCLVPADFFDQLLRTFSVPRLHFVLAEGKLCIEGDRGTSELQVHPLDDTIAPAVGVRGDVLATVDVPAQELIAALTAVLPAAARENDNPYLASVYVDTKVEPLTLVATDSFRMAVSHSSVGVPADPFALPVGGVQRLLRILDKAGEGDIRVTVRGEKVPSRVLFRVPHPVFRHFEIRLSVVDSSYPRYESVLERREEANTVVHVATGELMAVVTRALIMSAPPVYPVNVSVDPGGRVTISAQSALGNYGEGVEARVDGPGQTVRINATYLRDALRVFTPWPQVVVRLIDATSPVFIMPEGEDAPVFLIMPLRLE